MRTDKAGAKEGINKIAESIESGEMIIEIDQGYRKVGPVK